MGMKMKIAYVHDAVYPFIKGGAERRMYEVSRRLVKRGHEVHIYGMHWWKEKGDIELEGVKIHGVSEGAQLYSQGRRSIKSAAIFASKVFPKISSKRFDVIDCFQAPYLHSFPAKLSSVFKRSPLIITWHEVWRGYWQEYLGSPGVFGRLMEKMILLGLADRVIAVSDQTRDDLMKLGVDSKNISVVPNGVDYTHVQKINPSKETSDVVYLGRLIKPKNVDLLIRAAAELKKDFPRLRVSVIGSGPEQSSLETLAKELGVQDNVKFHGFVEDHDDVISLMKSSKVFVIPSIQEGGASIVTQEANACGLPAIAVDHPLGIDKRLIVQGENGFFTEVKPEAIAERIKQLLSDENLRKKMSENSLNFAREWDWENVVDKLENVYNSVI